MAAADRHAAAASRTALSGRRLILVGVLAGVLTLGGMAGVFMLVSQVFLAADMGEDQPVVAEQTVSDAAHPALSNDNAPAEGPPPTSSDSSLLTAQGTPATANSTHEAPNEIPNDHAASTEPSPASETSGSAHPPPLADVIDVLHEHLPLPTPEQDRSLSGPGVSALAIVAELAKVYVDDVENVELDLEGEEAVFPPGIQVTVEEAVSADKAIKTWKIVEPNPSGIVKTGTPIGEFRIQDRRLSFAWAPNVRSTKLKYCQLVIKAKNAAGAQTARCSLTDPIEQSPLKLNFDRTGHRTVLNFDPDSLPEAEHLRVELTVRGWEASRFMLVRNTLRLVRRDDSDDKATIEFRDPQSGGPPADRIVRVEVRVVQRATDQPELLVTNFVYPPIVSFVDQGTQHVPPGVKFGLAEQPLEFARNTRNSERRRNGRLKVDLGKALRALPGLIKLRGQELVATDRLPDHNKELKEQKTRLLEKARDQLADANKLQDDYRAAEAFVNSFDDWLRQLEDLYQRLEEEVEIDFRLYITVNGKETDIVRSRAASGPADEKDTGTPEVSNQKATSSGGSR